MVFRKRNFDFLLHLDAGEGLLNAARKLRKQETLAEKVLWRRLKAKKCYGLKFRRQHALHNYIADFYCHEQRLVIEVDGMIHNLQIQFEHDQNRTAELQRLGIRILRFTNEQVMNNLSSVVEEIIDFVKYHPIQEEI